MNQKFCDYYSNWIEIYKRGLVRQTTLNKYLTTKSWLYKLIPDLMFENFTRVEYQKLINAYAETHEKQTVMDFHHQVKSAIQDAVDEGLLLKDPTRRVVIKGKKPRDKKIKYLNKYDVQKLINDLNTENQINFDWLILLLIKTGIRFSEAVAILPSDFDFLHQTLSINKTWDYKNGGGFEDTKNESSKRKVKLDYQTAMQFFTLIQKLPA